MSIYSVCRSEQGNVGFPLTTPWTVLVVTMQVKNITTDVMASKVGQIHMERQDLGKLQTRKLKAFKERTVDSEEDDE